MKYLQFLLRMIFSLYGFLLFIAVLIVVFPFAVLLSFWGKVKGGNIIYKLCQLWADIVMPLWGIRHSTIFEVPHNRNKQYVFVFNHISYLDVPILMKAIKKQHFRVLGKAEMSSIPLFGFIYRQTVVAVERGNAAKRAKSVRQLKSVISKGISVVIAPEGTFNMTDKPLKDFYDGAFRIAIETQTNIKPILFLDAYDRLSYKNIFSLTPGKSRVIYLEEISVEGLTNHNVQFLKEKVYNLMEEKLIQYKASWINTSIQPTLINVDVN